MSTAVKQVGQPVQTSRQTRSWLAGQVSVGLVSAVLFTLLLAVAVCVPG